MSIFLIAEIGINHNGQLDIAKKLIDASVDAGFDAVKFQKRTIDKVYTKDFLDSPRESPWGTSQRDQKEGLEFTTSDYKEIDSYCKEKKIHWSASAWDIDAQIFLQQFNCTFNKVASPMLGHIPLPFELMHCNSTYPMKDQDANLLCIPMLKARYGCDVGYSGHESSLIKVCTSAVALGATSLERHITLDRAMYGSDQAASIETNALRNFVESVRAIPDVLGSGEKVLSEAEKKVREKLRITVQG